MHLDHIQPTVQRYTKIPFQPTNTLKKTLISAQNTWNMNNFSNFALKIEEDYYIISIKRHGCLAEGHIGTESADGESIRE